MELKMIICPKCGGDMPELRKTKFGYNFCVSCSDGKNLVGKKMALPIQLGEGDHTWNDIVIMDENSYNSYKNKDSSKPKKFKFDDDSESDDNPGNIRIIDYSKDEE